MPSLYSGFTHACQSVVLISRPTWIGTPPYRLSCRWWWIFPQGVLYLGVKLTKQRLKNWQVDGWKKGLSKCPPRRPLLASVLRVYAASIRQLTNFRHLWFKKGHRSYQNQFSVNPTVHANWWAAYTFLMSLKTPIDWPQQDKSFLEHN